MKMLILIAIVSLPVMALAGYFDPQPDYSTCKNEEDIKLVNKASRMTFDAFCGVPISCPITNENFCARYRRLEYGENEMIPFTMNPQFRYFKNSSFVINRYRKPDCWCWKENPKAKCDLKVWAVYLEGFFLDKQGYTESSVYAELERTTRALESGYGILFNRIYSRKECYAEFYNGAIKISVMRESDKGGFSIKLTFVQNQDMVLPHPQHFEPRNAIGSGIEALNMKSADLGSIFD